VLNLVEGPGWIAVGLFLFAIVLFVLHHLTQKPSEDYEGKSNMKEMETLKGSLQC
jgi:hypothetical protein